MRFFGSLLNFMVFLKPTPSIPIESQDVKMGPIKIKVTIILTREVKMETNKTGKEYESSEWSLKTLDRKPENS